MKLTNQQLKQIIREELKNTLREYGEPAEGESEEDVDADVEALKLDPEHNPLEDPRERRRRQRRTAAGPYTGYKHKRTKLPKGEQP